MATERRQAQLTAISPKTKVNANAAASVPIRVGSRGIGIFLRFYRHALLMAPHLQYDSASIHSKVGYFVGSLSKASINRKLAKGLVGLSFCNSPEMNAVEANIEFTRAWQMMRGK